MKTENQNNQTAIMSQMARQIRNLEAVIEDARQLAGSRRVELETAEHQIAQLMKTDQWQTGRIAELEADRLDLLQKLNAKSVRNTSDCLELVALNEQCEKLAADLKQMTRWRDIAAKESEKLSQKLINMTNNYGHQRDRAEKLDAGTENQTRTIIGLNSEAGSLRGQLKACRDLNDGQHGTIIELREECARLRHEVASGMERGGRVAAMLGSTPECHCDDLQKALGNLHKAGSSFMLTLTMSKLTIAFIEAMTRASDLLDELAVPVVTADAPARPITPGDDW